MLDLILGIAAAVAASTLYSLGIALQAMDAREAPRHERLHPALIRRLARRRRWLAGTGLSVLGWPLQLLALLLAPLVLVQPALACGLLVLLALAQRMLDEHAGRYEHVAMSAIVIGVVGAGLTAPSRSDQAPRPLALALVLALLALASLLPYVLRALRRPRALVTMVGAGLAFAWSGVSTKLAADGLSRDHLLVAALWALATGVSSITAVLSESSALGERPAIQVAPVVFVTQTVVPVALAPALLGERLATTPLGGAPLIASLALLLLGAAALARSPLLLALMEGERSSPLSGSAPSRSRPSHETIDSSPSTEEGEPLIATTTTSPARAPR
jgi:hypothetical protein